MNLRKAVNYLLILCFFIVPIAVWVRHFHPFVVIKEFLFNSIIIVTTVLLIISFILEGKFSIRKSRLSLAVFVYYAYNLISFLVFPYTEQIYFFNFSCVILLFYIISYNVDNTFRNRILYTLIIVAFLSSIYSFFQFFGIDYGFFVNYFGSRTTLGMRTFTFFGNPNLLGGFSVFILPIILAFFIRSFGRGNKKKPLILIYGGCFLLAFVALLMSQTRSSWIAFFVSMILFGLFYQKKKVQHLINKNRTAAIVVVIIIGVLFFASFFIMKNWLNQASSSPDSLLSPLTVGIRANYYKNTFNMISEKPLFGRGVGTFNVHYPDYRDKREAFKLGEVNPEYRVEHPHNEHLEVLHDLGIIGYLIFLWVIIEAIVLLWRKDLVSYGILIAIAGVLIDGLMTQNLRFVVIMSLLWLAIGFSNISSSKLGNRTDSNQGSFNIVKIILVVIVLLIAVLPLNFAYNLKTADYYVRGGIGFYVSNMREGPTSAISMFEEALKLHKNNKRALYYIAASHRSKAEIDKAIMYYERLVSIDPNFIQAHYHLGVMYFEKRDLMKAKYHFEQHIQSNNLYWKSYYGLGLVLSNLGDFPSAIRYFEEIDVISAIQQIPQGDYTEMKKQLANMYLRVNNREKALATLEMVYAIAPSEELAANIETLKSQM